MSQARALLQKIKLGLLIVTTSLSSVSQAQFWGSNSDDDKQIEIRQIARDRNYIGGADEDELRVLPELPGSKAKKTESDSEGF